MFNWLNTNAGAVMAVLTLVYVVVTVVLVALNWRNLRVLMELDRRRSRPHVVFDLVGKYHAVHLVVRNIGLTSAQNVAVSIDPPLQRGDRISPLTSHVIAHLAPGRELWDFIESGPLFYQRYTPPRFAGRLTYQDTDGRTYEESFRIDLEFQKQLVTVSKPDIGDEIKKIREALEAISSAKDRASEG